ncbi:PQQ-binding-like beta-propeller repeat protein [Spirochaeta cellobiosiphila]|uniref:PQQ-binding-like beta-propeller repeat protein n=1 Tax=Spirochaeta cellobiosiphila TaxID=504483 RepID=UPI00041F6717|nr:PQQ-binding-like beta-propeller repeat protein [Spirochaeta cellobiosiphila]
MKGKKYKVRYVIVPLLLIGVFFIIYKGFIYSNYYVSTLIPIDKERSLVLVTQEWSRRTDKKFIALNHIDKGIIWKYNVDSFGSLLANSFLYEKSFRRDVMIKNNQISVMLPKDKMEIFKFDLSTGDLIDKISIPLPRNKTMSWVFLHDKQNIYARSRNEEGHPCITAIDFDTLQILWQGILISDIDRSLYEKQLPFQNDHWIVFHSREDQNIELTAIKKDDGSCLNFSIDDVGVLKDDLYYYPRNNTSGNIVLNALDLRTGQISTKYDLPLLESLHKKAVTPESSIFLYKESLLYPWVDDSRMYLKALDINTGAKKWELPLPAHYYWLTPSISRYYKSSPLVGGSPYFRTPYVPFVLRESSSQSFTEDNDRLKHLVINLDKGEIAWQSKGVYLPRNEVINEVSELNHFRYPYYYMYLYVPGNRYEESHSIMGIDGNTGEILSWVRLARGHENSNEYLYFPQQIKTYALSSKASSIIPLSRNVFFDITTGYLEGKDKKSFSVEDIRKDMFNDFGL